MFILRRIFTAWVVIYGDFAFIWQMCLIFASSMIAILTPFVFES